MRQKIFTLSAMAALLFLAVGCTNDDGVQENGKGDSGKNEEAVAIFESKAPTTETSQDVTRTSITRSHSLLVTQRLHLGATTRQVNK